MWAWMCTWTVPLTGPTGSEENKGIVEKKKRNRKKKIPKKANLMEVIKLSRVLRIKDEALLNSDASSLDSPNRPLFIGTPRVAGLNVPSSFENEDNLISEYFELKSACLSTMQFIREHEYNKIIEKNDFQLLVEENKKKFNEINEKIRKEFNEENKKDLENILIEKWNEERKELASNLVALLPQSNEKIKHLLSNLEENIEKLNKIDEIFQKFNVETCDSESENSCSSSNSISVSIPNSISGSSISNPIHVVPPPSSSSSNLHSNSISLDSSNPEENSGEKFFDSPGKNEIDIFDHASSELKFLELINKIEAIHEKKDRREQLEARIFNLFLRVKELEENKMKLLFDGMVLKQESKFENPQLDENKSKSSKLNLFSINRKREKNYLLYKNKIKIEKNQTYLEIQELLEKEITVQKKGIKIYFKKFKIFVKNYKHYLQNQLIINEEKFLLFSDLLKENEKSRDLFQSWIENFPKIEEIVNKIDKEIENIEGKEEKLVISQSLLTNKLKRRNFRMSLANENEEERKAQINQEIEQLKAEIHCLENKVRKNQSKLTILSSAGGMPEIGIIFRNYLFSNYFLPSSLPPLSISTSTDGNPSGFVDFLKSPPLGLDQSFAKSTIPLFGQSNAPPIVLLNHPIETLFKKKEIIEPNSHNQTLFASRTIFKCFDEQKNKYFALKEFLFVHEEHRKSFEREISILIRCKNELIIQLLSVFYFNHPSKGFVGYLVYPFIHNSNLSSWVSPPNSSIPPPSPFQIKHFFRLLIQAVSYLHLLSIVHRGSFLSFLFPPLFILFPFVHFLPLPSFPQSSRSLSHIILSFYLEAISCFNFCFTLFPFAFIPSPFPILLFSIYSHFLFTIHNWMWWKGVHLRSNFKYLY